MYTNAIDDVSHSRPFYPSGDPESHRIWVLDYLVVVKKIRM